VRLHRFRRQVRRHAVSTGLLFGYMDRNRNDQISLGEFRAGLAKASIDCCTCSACSFDCDLCSQYWEEETQALFSIVDADQNGRVSWFELVKALDG
jgi:hypothetical protein